MSTLCLYPAVLLHVHVPNVPLNFWIIDPQHSTAKRQQRSQAFTSQLAHASLERQLAALTTNKNDLEKKLREKDAVIDRLEKDRRWLAEREKEEREEKEHERIEWDEIKVVFFLLVSLLVYAGLDTQCLEIYSETLIAN